MLYDNLSSFSQNVLKFYQQLTGEERRVPFIFGYGNRLDRCGEWVGGYILVRYAHSNTYYTVVLCYFSTKWMTSLKKFEMT